MFFISKQTTNLVKNVLKDHPKEDWAVNYIKSIIKNYKNDTSRKAIQSTKK